jgi:hypothetical protein
MKHVICIHQLQPIGYDICPKYSLVPSSRLLVSQRRERERERRGGERRERGRRRGWDVYVPPAGMVTIRSEHLTSIERRWRTAWGSLQKIVDQFKRRKVKVTAFTPTSGTDTMYLGGRGRAGH